MSGHDTVRDALLDGAARDALSADAAGHLAGCAECRAFADALDAVDDGLGRLPALRPADEVIARTLARVADGDVAEPELSGSVAAVEARSGADAAAAAGPGLDENESASRVDVGTRSPARRTGALGLLGALVAAVAGGLWSALKLLAWPLAAPKRRRRTLWIVGPALATVAAGLFVWTGIQSEERALHLDAVTTSDRTVAYVVDGTTGERPIDVPAIPSRTSTVVFDEPGDPASLAVVASRQGYLADEESVLLPSGSYRVSLRESYNGLDDDRGEETGHADLGVARDLGGEPAQPSFWQGTDRSRNEVDGRFFDDPLAARDVVDGLAFQPATGYWANTYVPGDPAIRSLRRRLADVPQALALADLAQPSPPRIDPPRDGALALAVRTDPAEVEGRSRVLVAVGLRGAAERAGRRPTLRAQVVLDMRDGRLDEARVRALLTALGRSIDGADRVGVIVAGPRGGTLLEPGTLPFGELTVALRRAFGAGDAPASALSLDDAITRAVASVGAPEEEDAAIGAGLVLLVTPGLTDADAAALVPVAHAGSLAGVATTVVDAGDAGTPVAHDRVALAGQGRRRTLDGASDADALVDAELAAASRVVARAVRLTVRLAPGVELVDVLGSHPLDDAAAHRVRETERAVDRALAQRLGITSDRGEDADGIQIVIPAFHADDAHTVLLDVVAPGPGPVADVSVRFKDLTRLGNRTLTGRAALSRGDAPRGPAERTVVTAWIAHRTSAALREAAALFERDEALPAMLRVGRAHAELERMRDAHPWLASEPAVGRDLALLDASQEIIGEGRGAPWIVPSLRVAAHRRAMGDPQPLD